MEFLPKREICAANKYIQRIDAYIHNHRGKRTKPRANKKCPYCPKFRQVKPVIDEVIRFGTTDSCVGDSGGPLWKWMGKTNKKAKFTHLHFIKISVALIFKAVDKFFIQKCK